MQIASLLILHPQEDTGALNFFLILELVHTYNLIYLLLMPHWRHFACERYMANLCE